MINVTSMAQKKISEFKAGNEDFKNKTFRVFVQGGGCGGFQYGFTFDEMQDGDSLVENNGVEVLIDESSMQYIENSTLDYVDDFRGSGFNVENPQATDSCGCGKSFSC